jgi:hypothetical protein
MPERRLLENTPVQKPVLTQPRQTPETPTPAPRQIATFEIDGDEVVETNVKDGWGMWRSRKSDEPGPPQPEPRPNPLPNPLQTNTAPPPLAKQTPEPTQLSPTYNPAAAALRVELVTAQSKVTQLEKKNKQQQDIIKAVLSELAEKQRQINELEKRLKEVSGSNERVVVVHDLEADDGERGAKAV